MDRIAHPHIFVSDTVEQARRDARESVEWLLDNFAATFELPDGEEYPQRFLARKRIGEYIRSLTFNRVIEEDLMWIGDANYIAERLKWLREDCGVTYIMSNMSPGGMEHEKSRKIDGALRGEGLAAVSQRLTLVSREGCGAGPPPTAPPFRAMGRRRQHRQFPDEEFGYCGRTGQCCGRSMQCVQVPLSCTTISADADSADRMPKSGRPERMPSQPAMKRVTKAA